MLLQCGGPPSMSTFQASELDASYMKYVPGAGGGKGIIFRVTSPDSIANLKVISFEVNGFNIPAELVYSQGQTVIEASRFYQQPETSEGGDERPFNTPLYNANSYKAVITYEYGHKVDSIQLTDFREEESPMYP